MCRIVGCWSFNASLPSLRDKVSRMRDTMTSGGPDDAGVFVDSSIALGHRRLSVIDLSPSGHQPMTYGSYTIVYNGEIYNFEEIRAELGESDFRGHSDTEVLLRAYIKWGTECIQKLRGMFAFAVWDSDKKELFLCRDRVGVKPLYWYFDDEHFMFASELKAFYANDDFKKVIDKSALSEFLSFGYISAPKTILENCHKLTPGHFLKIDKNKQITITQYWNPKAHYERKQDFSLKKLSALLDESFALRMVSDVPVGLFLSGGVDSSLVAASLAKQGFKPDTFTIGFADERFDESSYAARVADVLGLKNTTFIFDPSSAEDLIRKLAYIYDEPFGDSSALPTMFLAANTRKNVKVSLSADGADELFGGYDRYKWTIERRHAQRKFRFLGAISPSIPNELAIKIASSIGLSMGKDKFLRIKNSLMADTLLSQYAVDITHFRRDDLMDNGLALNESYEKYTLENDLESMMLFDFCRYLPDDILVKVDRASSGVGLEARDPFLDHKLVEYIFSANIDAKMPNAEPKGILKILLSEYLPKELVYRPKKGFGVPIESWLRTSLAHLLEETLDERSMEEFFDVKYVTTLKNDFLASRPVDFEKLWYIVVFQLWRKTWAI